VLADPVLADPVLAEVLSVGTPPVAAPPDAGELDAGELEAGETGVEGVEGVEGLALPGVDPTGAALGVTVLDGGAVVVWQRVPVDVAAFVLPFALVLAFAEAVVVGLLAAVVVAVAVATAESVAVALPLGLALLLAGLPLGLLLVLPLGGLVTGLAGGTFGVADLVGLAAAVDEEVDGHGVGGPLLWPAEARPWLAPPPDEPAGLPDPVTPAAPPLVLEEEIPTAEPSWTKASRSGGTARAMPMANTAQATARAGRSSPYRQSRGCRAPPPPGASCPPRTAFQRRTRSARKPPRAVAPACLLA
jgi:hypothetical protein